MPASPSDDVVRAELRSLDAYLQTMADEIFEHPVRREPSARRGVAGVALVAVFAILSVGVGLRPRAIGPDVGQRGMSDSLTARLETLGTPVVRWTLFARATHYSVEVWTLDAQLVFS
ncbi:MAG: hypothetical protein GKS06_07890 [Acidobacteria bacterium]|nr:hypothetical protein [Acidobacteriota bacterium]